ncbi:hypothetical protein N7486_006812 [Penicillium sp. IBT 16267x]|nr:hypothetical protein N7486_006812 [Penicillium sp. IBT 16267x]
MAQSSQPANTSSHDVYDALPSGKDPRPNAVDTYFKAHLHSANYHDTLETIHRDSLVAGLPDIACSAPQAKFLMFQARMCNAKRILEVGTLGGYSAAWFAMTSPQTKVTTIELDRHHAAVARQNLEKAGLSERVEILQGLGTTVLHHIREEVQRGEREKFDFVFIDANKQDNLAYFNAAMDITREGSVIIVDNVVRDGKVASAEEAEKDDRVRGTRKLIEAIGQLEEVEATAIQTAQFLKPQVSSTNSVHRFNVPFSLTHVPLTENFIGRQDELNHLWEYLNPKESRSRKVAILHGLGGIGKTQLAVSFAREHKHNFTAIFWISGKDRATLLQSLSSVLPRLPGQPPKNEAANDEEIEQRARDVLEWLNQDGNSHWLIIFDNIDQYSPIDGGFGDAYNIAKFFPAADHGSILITTPLPGLTQLGKSFPIHKLESTEAIELLLNKSGLKSKTVEKLKGSPDTLALAERLDGLPLAIVIAAAFMRETGTSITHQILSASTSKNRDPNAARLLLLLARFDNRDIWYELVQSTSNSFHIPEWLEKAISNGLAFKVCVKPLIEFSLLEAKQQEGSYAKHPVVQDWCVHMASTDTIVNPIRLSELALICVGYSVPDTGERDYMDLERRLLPHTIGLHTGQLSTDNTAIFGGFHGLGCLYSDQGKLKEAEEMYQRALTGYEKALGPDHISTLDTVNNLGILYRYQGKLKEAEEMYQRALEGYEKALGPDHTFTLNTVNNLGILYRYQGKLKEAEEMYQRALAGKEKALGPDHASTLDTVNSLRNLYSDQEKLKEAEEAYREGLLDSQKVARLNANRVRRAIGKFTRWF